VRFDTGRPALDAFPWTVWLRLLGRAARAQAREDRAYGHPGGLPALREAIAAYLARSRGLRCAPDDVIVTSGFQQSLDVIVRMLVDPGDRAVIEDPVYERVRETLLGAGAAIVPVPVDADGLRVDRLPRDGDPPKLLYTTPSHQYPTGAILSLQRRLDLLAWAEASSTVIVEDDYDGELRYDGRPVPPLAGLALERNATTGSFSKVLFPTVRLGYTLVPRDMAAPCIRAHEAIDRTPPTVLQAAVAAMIGEGHFERHLARMRRLYATRHETLVAAIARHLGDRAAIAGPTGSTGLHVLLRVRTDRSEAEIVERAAAEGVRLAGASGCYATPPAETQLLLGFAGTPTEQIDDGVARLLRAIAP
jgi:GntR family transcriptional regulator/MocR family aminotransferase